MTSLVQVLKRQHLESALDVSHMLDGVVTFVSMHDADKYASLLEEEGHSKVRTGHADR